MRTRIDHASQPLRQWRSRLPRSTPLRGQSQTAASSGRAGRRPSRPLNPRTADGHPDLQGIYDIATLTPLERPAMFGNNLTLTPKQAKRLEQQVADRKEHAARPSDGNRAAPPIGGDGSTGAAGNVGGYNNFWIDSGSEYVTVERPEAHVDHRRSAGRPRAADHAPRRGSATPRGRKAPTSDQQEGTDPGLERAPAPTTIRSGGRSASAACSVSARPRDRPRLPVLYNNLHQIVQTRDSVMILNEMDHDARIVRMNAEHLPQNIRKWMGDSIGRWEGDTLVVDTTNFTDKTRFRGSTDHLHVVERFTRVDDKTLLYRFTVEDPATWARPWTGEYTWPATDTQLFEYACHEGNYALGNILRGARQRDAKKPPRRAGIGKIGLRLEMERRLMRTKVVFALAGVGLFVAAAMPVVAHHAFGGEFDANRPVLLKGTVGKVERVNPHAWIHIVASEVTVAGEKKDLKGATEEWMVEGGTPNTLLRRGITRDSLAGNPEVVVDGYQTRDHTLHARQRPQHHVHGRPQAVHGFVGHRRAERRRRPDRAAEVVPMTRTTWQRICGTALAAASLSLVLVASQAGPQSSRPGSSPARRRASVRDRRPSRSAGGLEFLLAHAARTPRGICRQADDVAG